MMTTKFLFAGLLGTLAVAAAPVADGADATSGHGPRGPRMCKHLECTPEQAEKIGEIEREHKEDITDERAKLKQIRGQLASEFEKNKMDKGVIVALSAQRNALQNAIATSRLDAMIQAHAVLTPEQRAKLAKKFSSGGFEHRGRHRRGNGHGKKMGEGQGPDAMHGADSTRRDKDGQRHAKRGNGPRSGPTSGRRGPAKQI